ncbi:RNA-dependent RNA polymerase 1 [Hordeum vulgare]|nr:RNA-dependent RNA polymerase 1 [Hordeum vulgare]
MPTPPAPCPATSASPPNISPLTGVQGQGQLGEINLPFTHHLLQFGLEEICDDEKLDEMLDHIANKDETIVNVTLIRATDPRPADLNSSYLYGYQVSLSQIGEKHVYEVNPSGVLFRSLEKFKKQKQPQPPQFISTQQSTNWGVALDDAME